MSLPESTQTLLKLEELQAEITSEQNIFDKADIARKSLQKDIENKQLKLESLKENLQEQDNDTLKSLTKLWQQQAEIKRQLSEQSENGIKKIIQGYIALIKIQSDEIELECEKIRSEIEQRKKLNLFLQENQIDIDSIDQGTKDAFSQLVEKGDKQELLTKNVQDIAALNAMLTDLYQEYDGLTEQEQKLKNYSLADNLAYDTELQKLFEERQADITKKIDNIISQQNDSELKNQYENIKRQEEEIKLIQKQIEEKNQIIKQTEQRETELFTELEQLQQESAIPQFSSKQEGEEIVNQYPILQERTNDVIASIKHQIELNKLNVLIEQQGEEIKSEKNKADSLVQQLEKLELSTNEQIKRNLITIEELQENIKRLEKKERQLITPQGSSWADELKEVGEPSEFVQLEDQIGELTKENSDLKASLEALGVLSAEKDKELKVAEEGYKKELNRQSEQAEAGVTELQAASEKLLQLETQLGLEQQGRQEELEGKQKIVEGLQEILSAESNQSKELQTKLNDLTTVNDKLENALKVEKEKHKEELKKQSERDLTELQEVNEALSTLKVHTAILTKENGDLKASLKTLETLSAEKDEGLNAAEKSYTEKLSKQSQQTEAELRGVNEKLSNLQTQLTSEQQERQEELKEKQQELLNVTKNLEVVRQEHEAKSKESEHLQTKLNDLTMVNDKLENELKVEKEKHKEELNRQSQQSEAKLQAANEKLSNLQIQLGLEQQKRKEELEQKQEIVEELQKSLSVESNQAENLQTQMDKLIDAQQQLTTKLEEAKKNAENQLEALSAKKDLEYNKLNAEKEGLEVKLKEQSEQAEASVAELQAVKEELSKLQTQLKSQQQEKQKELGESQQIVKELQDSLSVEQQKFVEKSNQAENLQTQVSELTNAQQQFATQLEEAEKNAKNQLETLSVEKDLVYNELKAEKERFENELKKQSDIVAEQAQENRNNASRITELESQNAALLAQLASLKVKVKTSEVGMQTDEVLSNTMESVGTETEPVMGSGVSTKEAMTNTTEVIIQEQTVSPVIERQTIDKVLVHDNDDDKILRAFKKLSRDQVQPIIDKCDLESGSNFAKFATENVDKLSEVFHELKVLRDIENIEQKGYADIHKEFASEYKDIIWQGKDVEKSFSLQQNGKDVAIISEKKNDVEYKTSDGKPIKNARMVDIPLSVDIKGSCHMSFAVRDTNGRNISKENAVYLTAHYNNGKLVHLTKPTEIFACSEDKNSPLYLKRDGKIYTLPVDKYALEQLEKEVLKNKGEYVGIVKNASGAIISINSGASQEGRSDRLKDDASFKIASQVLHANATHTTNSSIDRKEVFPKKHNQYANRGV